MIEIGNAKIYTGDVMGCLKLMPDNSVHCCVCSPPYWGLRDYKAGSDMIGLEPTFQEWLDKMVAVSAELWRVLRDDGTYWLNCGDAYHGSWGNSGSREGGQREVNSDKYERPAYSEHTGRPGASYPSKIFKTKDLLMMPARLAIALQDAGWYVRSEIVWAKPNPMPESVRDRPTSSHEKIYLLTKKPRYFYDADAVKERAQTIPGATWEERVNAGAGKIKNIENPRTHTHGDGSAGTNLTPQDGNRNQRNVWNIATKPYPDAHFATFPPEIPRRCIMAGTSERGCCPECGNQWERVVETERVKHTNTPGSGGRQTCEDGGKVSDSSCFRTGLVPINKTTGWQPTCTHGHEPTPSTVLDIFAGSGTTLEVALSLNRKAIGIELNPEYVELMKSRIMKEASQEKLSW